MRALKNAAVYDGENLAIRAYPGLKMLSLYQQFGGHSAMIDAIMLVIALSLGLPDDKELAYTEA